MAYRCMDIVCVWLLDWMLIQICIGQIHLFIPTAQTANSEKQAGGRIHQTDSTRARHWQIRDTFANRKIRWKHDEL